MLRQICAFGKVNPLLTYDEVFTLVHENLAEAMGSEFLSGEILVNLGTAVAATHARVPVMKEFV